MNASILESCNIGGKKIIQLLTITNLKIEPKLAKSEDLRKNYVFFFMKYLWHNLQLVEESQYLVEVKEIKPVCNVDLPELLDKYTVPCFMS